MKIIIINGPNLNLLGIRRKEIYGDRSFDDFYKQLKQEYKNIDLEYFQSNSEGELIEQIQRVGFSYNGIVLNAGAYSHTSIAIADAIEAIKTPVIEVHISNIFNRERFRKHSYLSKYCKGLISGLGLKGYSLAIRSFL